MLKCNISASLETTCSQKISQWNMHCSKIPPAFFVLFLFGLFVLWKIPTNCGLDSEIKSVSLTQPFSMNFLFTKKLFSSSFSCILWKKMLIFLGEFRGRKKKENLCHLYDCCWWSIAFPWCAWHSGGDW